jgi:hypothetical protein
LTSTFTLLKERWVFIDPGVCQRVEIFNFRSDFSERKKSSNVSVKQPERLSRKELTREVSKFR